MWNENDFNSTFSSPNAGKDTAKKNYPKNVVPVNAETINKCTHVENESTLFEYNHLKFSQICIVGIIRSVLKRANDITYLLDDMTSTDINVKLQADDADDIETEQQEMKESQHQFMENQYVRVYGIIKSLQGQKIVQAFKILPLRELNEITHHMLECMNASIYFLQKANGLSGDMCGMDMPSKSTNNQNKSNAGLTGLHNQVSALIKTATSSEGLHINEICSHFPGVAPTKIKEIIEFLSTEGHIYSTLDDDHFKTTDSYN